VFEYTVTHGCGHNLVVNSIWKSSIQQQKIKINSCIKHQQCREDTERQETAVKYSSSSCDVRHQDSHESISELKTTSPDDTYHPLTTSFQPNKPNFYSSAKVKTQKYIGAICYGRVTQKIPVQQRNKQQNVALLPTFNFTNPKKHISQHSIIIQSQN